MGAQGRGKAATNVLNAKERKKKQASKQALLRRNHAFKKPKKVNVDFSVKIIHFFFLPVFPQHKTKKLHFWPLPFINMF